MDTLKERQALEDQIEEFKLGLMSRATGGNMDPSRYRELRKTILGTPPLFDVIPKFLRVCSTPDDFWTFIKGEFPTYHERREFIGKAIAPLIERIQGIEGTASTELAIGEVLGRGGFGVVYRAHHRILDMDFAVKVFDPAFDAGEPAPLDRFFREARILLKLNHPNIVRIFDAGFLKGKPFIRMEFLEGKNLDRFLQDHGRMTLKKAVVLIRKVLDALTYVQEEGKVCPLLLLPNWPRLALPSLKRRDDDRF